MSSVIVMASKAFNLACSKRLSELGELQNTCSLILLKTIFSSGRRDRCLCDVFFFKCNNLSWQSMALVSGSMAVKKSQQNEFSPKVISNGSGVGRHGKNKPSLRGFLCDPTPELCGFC